MEDDPVGTGLDVGEVGHAPVAVGLALGQELVAAKQLDANPGGGHPLPGVQNVGGDHTRILNSAWHR
jgi:hypothetical protein